jgi:hypothetical protein
MTPIRHDGRCTRNDLVAGLALEAVAATKG